MYALPRNSLRFTRKDQLVLPRDSSVQRALQMGLKKRSKHRTNITNPFYKHIAVIFDQTRLEVA
jgi:hypothetical protein